MIINKFRYGEDFTIELRYENNMGYVVLWDEESELENMQRKFYLLHFGGTLRDAQEVYYIWRDMFARLAVF